MANRDGGSGAQLAGAVLLVAALTCLAFTVVSTLFAVGGLKGSLNGLLNWFNALLETAGPERAQGGEG